MRSNFIINEVFCINRSKLFITLLILFILPHSLSYAETKRSYIEFCGSAQIVDGACMLIDTGKSRVLVDFGLFYSSQYEEMNKKITFDPSSIDHVILTHGHLDHSGRIPFLYKKGFKGKVYSTDATKDITEVMLNMSLGIMREKGKILYETEDLMKTLESLQSMPYDQSNKITEDITLTFRDAGHILGSAIAEIVIKTTKGDTKIVATGDMGYNNMPIIKKPSLIKEGDFVIVESTYGAKRRKHTGYEDFGRDIQETINQGGSVLIPAFSLDKTQKVLYIIGELKRKGVIKRDTPVIADSSTAKALTSIYRRYPQNYNEDTKAVLRRYGDPLGYESLFEVRGDVALKQQESKTPKIFVSTSGMLDHSNAPKHLLKMIDNPMNLLAIVGWQSPESLGRKLQEGHKEVIIQTTEYKDGVKQVLSHKKAVKIRVKRYGQFSSHADGCYILNWLSNFEKTKAVLVIHGDKENALALSSEIRKRLGFSSTAPRLNDRIYLDDIEEAKSRRVFNKDLLCDGLGNNVSIVAPSDQ